MKRIYEEIIRGCFKKYKQMLFLAGPRQVGKTTISSHSYTQNKIYLNWDLLKDRKLIMQGPEEVAKKMGIESDTMGETSLFIVFDELHKYSKWKLFLKGFFDKYAHKIKAIVTGSARLDIYKAGGDSLMGRYFLYRIHPLSVAEILFPSLRETEVADQAKEIDAKDFEALYQFGGFPDPYLQRNLLFYNQWKRLRFHQLFAEDIRDLTRIQEIKEMEVLAELLKEQVGSICNYHSLSNKISVSVDTVSRWVQTLKAFYYCFTIKPWTKNVTRSLLKEPKVFLWDWSLVQDEGAKRENFIASHLLKAVHFWTDRGFGDFDLFFLRDKEKRAVDFLVSKNQKPWFIVEVKSSENKGISKNLYYFQQATGAEHAFQVVFDKEFVSGNVFSYRDPVIVPVKTFLSQLV